MASHYYFMLTKEEWQHDPSKTGFAYAKQHKDRWVQNEDIGEYLAPGYNVGEDFVVYEDKVYWVKKTFTDISNNEILTLCMESVQACDIRENFDS